MAFLLGDSITDYVLLRDAAGDPILGGLDDIDLDATIAPPGGTVGTVTVVEAGDGVYALTFVPSGAAGQYYLSLSHPTAVPGAFAETYDVDLNPATAGTLTQVALTGQESSVSTPVIHTTTMDPLAHAHSSTDILSALGFTPVNAAGDAITGDISTTGTLTATNGVVTKTTVGAPVSADADGTLSVDVTNDALYFRSDGAWVATGGGGGAAIAVKDGGSTIVAAAAALNLNGTAFAVTDEGSNQALVTPAFGTGAGVFAEGNHAHAHSALTGVVVDTADADIHHTLGTSAFTAAKGNHTHAHSALSSGITTDTADADIHHTLGTGTFQAAKGNHTHAHTALTAIDTDGGPTSIHHTLGTTPEKAAAGNHLHSATYALIAHTHKAVNPTTQFTFTASVSTAVQTLVFYDTIAANQFVAGDVYVLTGHGSIDNGAVADTFTFSLACYGAVLATKPITFPATLQTQKFWKMDAKLEILTIGVTGTVTGHLDIYEESSATGGPRYTVSAGVLTIDTTVASNMSLRGKFNNLNAGHTMRRDLGAIWKVA